jgi:hypothetical protein
MEVTYSLVFDDAGVIIAKDPVAIMIGVPGSKTPGGLDIYLGYMKYRDVMAHLTANSKNVSATMRALLEKQTGLFRTVEYGELLASDQ